MKKKSLGGIFAVLLLVAVASCQKEDQNQGLYYETMGTVISVGDYPSFQTDAGSVLNCTNEVQTDTGSIIEKGERYFLWFLYDDTTNHEANVYPVVLKGYAKVTLKDYVTLDADSVDECFYNQALSGLSNMTIGGDYLNLVFHAYKSYLEPSDFELIRLVYDTNASPQDTLPNIYFNFRHNNQVISATFTEAQFYSFDLRPLAAEFPMAKSIRITLRWVDVKNGLQMYTRNYSPSDFGKMEEGAIKQCCFSHSINPPGSHDFRNEHTW